MNIDIDKTNSWDNLSNTWKQELSPAIDAEVNALKEKLAQAILTPFEGDRITSFRFIVEQS